MLELQNLMACLSRLFTVLYFSVSSLRSRALHCGLPSCMSVKITNGAGAVWEEASTVITSPQLMFRRRDRNFTPFTIH